MIINKNMPGEFKNSQLSVDLAHSSEREKKPIKWLIYRANKTSESLMNDFQNSLESLGYEVKKQVFPEGTGDEEIGEWYGKNKGSINEKDLVSDSTFSKATGAQGESIDSIMNNAVARIIIGEGADKFDSRFFLDNFLVREIGSEGKIYSGILKAIKRKRSDFNRVYIITEFIADHSVVLRGVNRDQRRTKDSEYAEFLKGQAIQSGIPKAEVISIAELLNDEHRKLIESGKAYVIYDRHLNSSTFDPINNPSLINSPLAKIVDPGMDKFLEKFALPLPLSDLYSVAQKKFGFSTDSGDLKKEIAKIIKSKFSKEV